MITWNAPFCGVRFLHEFVASNGAKSKCWVWVEKELEGKVFVVIQELASNKGMSVTNAIEQIANEVFERFKGFMLTAEKWELEWYEWWPEHLSSDAATMSRVFFQIDNGKYVSPIWKTWISPWERMDMEARGKENAKG